VDTTSTVFSAPAVTILDRQTGRQTDVPLPRRPIRPGRPYDRRRRDRASDKLHPRLARPPRRPISADGARAFYLADELRVRDLRTGEDRLVATGQLFAAGFSEPTTRAASPRRS
jgi:hypothetical protein